MTTFSIDFIQAQDQSIIDPKPNSKGFRLVNIEILISPQRSNHMNKVYTKGPLGYPQAAGLSFACLKGYFPLCDKADCVSRRKRRTACAGYSVPPLLVQLPLDVHSLAWKKIWRRAI